MLLQEPYITASSLRVAFQIVRPETFTTWPFKKKFADLYQTLNTFFERFTFSRISQPSATGQVLEKGSKLSPRG